MASTVSVGQVHDKAQEAYEAALQRADEQRREEASQRPARPRDSLVQRHITAISEQLAAKAAKPEARSGEAASEIIKGTKPELHIGAEGIMAVPMTPRTAQSTPPMSPAVGAKLELGAGPEGMAAVPLTPRVAPSTPPASPTLRPRAALTPTDGTAGRIAPTPTVRPRDSLVHRHICALNEKLAEKAAAAANSTTASKRPAVSTVVPRRCAEPVTTSHREAAAASDRGAPGALAPALAVSDAPVVERALPATQALAQGEGVKEVAAWQPPAASAGNRGTPAALAPAPSTQAASAIEQPAPAPTQVLAPGDWAAPDPKIKATTSSAPGRLFALAVGQAGTAVAGSPSWVREAASRRANATGSIEERIHRVAQEARARRQQEEEARTPAWVARASRDKEGTVTSVKPRAVLCEKEWPALDASRGAATTREAKRSAKPRLVGNEGKAAPPGDRSGVSAEAGGC